MSESMSKHTFQGTGTKMADGNEAFASLKLPGGGLVSLKSYVLVSASDDTSDAAPYVARVVQMYHNTVSKPKWRTQSTLVIDRR